MGIFGDTAREDAVKFFCQKIAEKVEKYKENPDVIIVLTGLGIETLNTLPNVPEWSAHYYRLFRVYYESINK